MLSRQLTRDRCSSRVDGQLVAWARSAAAAARGAGETGRARFHGGFVGSRAVRRRKRVSWRPRQARGSRARRRRGCYALAEDRISKFCAPRAKRSSLDVCMRALRSFKSEFEDAGPRCVRNFPPASFSLAILQLQNMPYPKYALMSSGAQDRWGEVPGLLGPGFAVGRASRRKPPSRGMALRSDYTPPPRVHGLPLIICQSGFANIWCAHRVRGTRRVEIHINRGGGCGA